MISFDQRRSSFKILGNQLAMEATARQNTVQFELIIFIWSFESSWAVLIIYKWPMLWLP